MTEDHLSGLVEIVEDESIAQGILRAAKISMGMDTSEQGSPHNLYSIIIVIINIITMCM